MAQPFIKWAGGKQRIAARLAKNTPGNFREYWEPFTGGGSLFFKIGNDLAGSRTAHISDSNDDLMTAYRAIRDEPEKVAQILDEHERNHSESYYYKIREQHDIEGQAERAARLIFLNQAGYNGLTRYNRQGHINTAWGHKKNPITIYDAQNIRECSRLLQSVDIATRTYEKIEPGARDLVYIDPPYLGSDSRYMGGNWQEKDHQRLAEFCRELDRAGVLFMLSHSRNDYITGLYAGFNMRNINAPRAISRTVQGRKSAQEVIITNY